MAAEMKPNVNMLFITTCISRFCGECRTKVQRAYALLVETPEPITDKGYVPALYAGIKRCLPDKHIHLQTKTEYIADLITRAEPELMGRSVRLMILFSKPLFSLGI